MLCLSLNFCLVVIVVAVLEVFGLLLVSDSFVLRVILVMSRFIF